MDYALESAIARALGNDMVIIGSYSTGSYQGEARIFAMSADGTRVADGSVTWGSCSVCDPWDGMSDEKIAVEMDRQIVVLDTADSIAAYLTKIARPGEKLSAYYDDDARIARQAREAWMGR